MLQQAQNDNYRACISIFSTSRNVQNVFFGYFQPTGAKLTRRSEVAAIYGILVNLFALGDTMQRG